MSHLVASTILIFALFATRQFVDATSVAPLQANQFVPLINTTKAHGLLLNNNTVTFYYPNAYPQYDLMIWLQLYGSVQKFNLYFSFNNSVLPTRERHDKKVSVIVELNGTDDYYISVSPNDLEEGQNMSSVYFTLEVTNYLDDIPAEFWVVVGHRSMTIIFMWMSILGMALFVHVIMCGIWCLLCCKSCVNVIINRNQDDTLLPFQVNRYDSYGTTQAQLLTRDNINEVSQLITITSLDDGIMKDAYNTTCAVCQQDFTANEIVRHLRCRHVYHKPCVDDWLFGSPPQSKCPMCQQSVHPAEE